MCAENGVEWEVMPEQVTPTHHTLCQRIAVLNFGRIISRGDPDHVRNDPQVIEAYLGREDDEDTEQAGAAK